MNTVTNTYDLILANNLDLLLIGLMITGTLILGFIIWSSGPKSTTNRTFFLLSLVTIFYAITNYISYTIQNPILVLWSLRFVLFFALLHTFLTFRLFYVFPKTKEIFPTWYYQYLIPTLISVSLLTLSPLTFSSLGGDIIASGEVPNPERGAGMPLFGFTIVSLVASGIYLLAKKTAKSRGIERKQFQFILLGTTVTYLSLILFNFILPVIFNNLTLIPFAPLFILPFIVFTAYAILKHHLFNIKVIAAEVFVFILSIATLLQVLFSRGTIETFFRIFIFVLVLVFGIWLIQSVQREVKQRQKIEQIAEELAIANKHLRDMDQLKSEFVSIASHQLRAPLTAIKGYASMLLEGSFGTVEAKARDAIDRIFQSSERLVVIIEDFLNVSQIEQGKLSYEFTTVELKALVEDVVDELISRAEKKGLKLKIHNDGLSKYKITADYGKIRQVVSNLIDNSIKYTPQGKIEIFLTKDRKEGKIQLSIQDTGIGMSKNTMENLFQKFSRAKGISKTNTEGSGLGLYVAAEMIKAHHGRIWAESAGENKGTKISIELLSED